MDSRLLREFIEYLLARDPHASQAGLARRCGLSQSVINKLILEAGTRRPDVETFQKLASGFPMDWAEFLEAHPDARQQIIEFFRFALPFDTPSKAQEGDRELSEATRLLEIVFKSSPPATREALLIQLRSQARANTSAEAEKVAASGGSRLGQPTPRSGSPHSRT
jgi:transcriptional regulator with XRE-family HTH domain